MNLGTEPVAELVTWSTELCEKWRRNSLPDANLPTGVGLDTLTGFPKFHAAPPERSDRVHGLPGRNTRPTLFRRMS